MDKSFPISDFPFTRSGFLYKIHDARSKFEDAKNKIIDYRQFHYRIEFEAKFYEIQYQFERLTCIKNMLQKLFKYSPSIF